MPVWSPRGSRGRNGYQIMWHMPPWNTLIKVLINKTDMNLSQKIKSYELFQLLLIGRLSNSCVTLSSLQCTHWSMASKVVQLWTSGNGTSMSEGNQARYSWRDCDCTSHTVITRGQLPTDHISNSLAGSCHFWYHYTLTLSLTNSRSHVSVYRLMIIKFLYQAKLSVSSAHVQHKPDRKITRFKRIILATSLQDLPEITPHRSCHVHQTRT